VETEDFAFEGFHSAGGGLDEEEIFAGGFDFSLPAVNGFERGDLDVDAGGEVFLEEGAGDFAGFGEGGAGYEDEAELGGGGHRTRGKIVADLDSSGEESGKDNAEGAEDAEKKRKKRKKMGDIGW